MLRLLVLITFIPLVLSFESFRHLEDVVVVAKPALDIRNTFISTPPHKLSGRAILSILKRQNVCGSGYCNAQATCCGSSGCCPGGASCCSNGSCCEAGTLCTRDSGGSIGCCPIGQTCSGVVAGNGETNGTPPGTPSTQSSSSPTSLTSASPASSSGISVSVNDQPSDKANNSTSVSAERKSEPENTSLPSSSPATTEVGGGTILGAVIGGILGWIALCALFLWIRKRRRGTTTTVNPGQPAPLVVSRGLPGGRQEAQPDIVGFSMEIPGDPRAPRPYTTLLGRDDAAKVAGLALPK